MDCFAALAMTVSNALFRALLLESVSRDEVLNEERGNAARLAAMLRIAFTNIRPRNAMMMYANPERTGFGYINFWEIGAVTFRSP
jgi:hypothetical protein